MKIGQGQPLVVRMFWLLLLFSMKIVVSAGEFYLLFFMIKSSECDPILLYCWYNGWSICEGDNVRLAKSEKKITRNWPPKEKCPIFGMKHTPTYIYQSENLLLNSTFQNTFTWSTCISNTHKIEENHRFYEIINYIKKYLR